VATEKKLPHRHLISQNIANGAQKVEKPHPAVSLFNFHYATPPEAVTLNYHLDKALGDNETGFKGTGDTHYRMEGWQFILAGGALYNNLDYSFTVGHEDGMFQYPATQPGGGGRAFRQQMKTLKKFIESFNFLRLKPDTSFIKSKLPDKTTVHALAEPGQQYAVYFFSPAAGNQFHPKFDLPPGKYEFEWLDPVDGQAGAGKQQLDHPGGLAMLGTPKHLHDIALRLVRLK
jgi:hypothetical protein